MLITPDLSYYFANSELGLGDPSHNRKVMSRETVKQRRARNRNILLWGIWKDFQEISEDEYETVIMVMEVMNQKKVSFLD